MKIKEKRNGISLIVLVITIIVMIIIAAAIILSLNSSGIIEKASTAKDTSDRAMLLERAKVYLAEEMLNSDGQVTSETLDKLKEKLKEEGFNSSVVDEIKIVDNTIIVPNETAIKILEAGAKIGDTVEGYKLENITSYTTEGKENTCKVEYNEDDGVSCPNTVAQKSDVAWIYIGIDDNGNALITSKDPIGGDGYTVTLGGKGGYKDGPKVLDEICNKLYSSEKGIARNMNIDDVTRVLSYTGPKGLYYDESGNEITMTIAKTIGEIETQLGKKLISRKTQEQDKLLEDYYLDYYYISNESQLNYKLIFKSQTYWLSSSCVYASFYYKYANFLVRQVCSSDVGGYCVVNSKDQPCSFTWALRPVVSLAPDVNVNYENNKVVLS